MRNICNIIRDLLPLYCDEICSEESKEMIEEHLPTCQECNKILEKMQSNSMDKENILPFEIEKSKVLKNIKKSIFRKKVLTAALAVTCTIAIIFCYYEKSKITYSAPTKEQVNEFISKNSFNAVTIKETRDFSIVLFGNEAAYGHYVLYQDQNNKLHSEEVIASGYTKDRLLSLGGVASGKTPFITVIINDEEVLKKAKEVEITFDDGTVVSEEITDKGVVVLYKNEKNENPKTNIYLKIYDKDRNILYEE